jgi:hypothetical protein
MWRSATFVSCQLGIFPSDGRNQLGNEINRFYISSGGDSAVIPSIMHRQRPDIQCLSYAYAFA